MLCGWVSVGEQEDSSSCDAEQVCGQQAAAAQEIRDECETDLLQALPALRSAVEALKELTSSDIVVVKSMKKPPEGVKLVLAAVCIVLKVQSCAQPTLVRCRGAHRRGGFALDR